MPSNGAHHRNVRLQSAPEISKTDSCGTLSQACPCECVKCEKHTMQPISNSRLPERKRGYNPCCLSYVCIPSSSPPSFANNHTPHIIYVILTSRVTTTSKQARRHQQKPPPQPSTLRPKSTSPPPPQTPKRISNPHTMASPAHHFKFDITMTCSGCSGAVDRVLKKTEGISPYPLLFP